MFQILWQSPSALFALAVIAAPILIHILVHRRAETFAFPTLRFLQPTRLAAIRRHVLEDAPLLAVRAAILGAAVAALAGPLVVTPARRQSWDNRVVRAVVRDADSVAPPPGVGGPEETLRGEFTADSLRDGVHLAIAWLASSPPARRELVVASRFPIGSITAADIATIPAAIGIRFERAGPLPASQTVDAGRVLRGSAMLTRRATLDGPHTIVRETAAADSAAWPIEIVAPPAAQPAVDAAVAAVLSQRVWAPAPDRRARVVMAIRGSNPNSGSDPPNPNSGSDPPNPNSGSDPPNSVPDSPSVGPDPVIAVRTAWIADAIARLVRDDELQAAAARVESSLAAVPFSSAPWVTVASSKGDALAAAAESGGRLLVASAAPARDLFTPLLLRSLANALGSFPDLQRAEIVPIADRWLREWSRPPAPPAVPDADALRRNDTDNDRRWLWLAALALLAFETWMRRSRPAPDERREDIARVA